jgi:hypothetical protein
MLETFLEFGWTSEYSRKADSWSLLAFAIGLVVIALTKNIDFGPRKKSVRLRCSRRS